MAYTLLADTPYLWIVCGLSSIVFYALLGSSYHLPINPVVISALLTFSSIIQIAKRILKSILVS